MAKPIILVCGAPKLGKSTEVFKTFQNSLAILSSENNAHYYKKLLTTKLKDVSFPGATTPRYRPPKRIKLIDVSMTGATKDPYTWLKPGDAKPKKGKIVADANGNKSIVPDENGDRVIPVPQRFELMSTISTVVTKSQMAIDKGEPPPYDNVIIDELGEFLDRVHSEILPECVTQNNKQDTRSAFLATGEWVATMVNQLKQLIPCGVGVCLVMHDRDPEGKKKGGPKAPSATISRKLVGQVDGAIQRVMIDPKPDEKNEDGSPAKPRRIWRAMASEEWDIGLRGLEPEDEDKIGQMELYDIIVDLCGFDMQPLYVG